jgi:hypothetical protein
MTRYTVVWDLDVEAQFVAAWVAGDAQIRDFLTEVANWVDTNLAVDPDQKGQSRDDVGARLLAVPVSTSLARVAVTFRVHPDDRQVRIVRLVIRGA